MIDLFSVIIDEADLHPNFRLLQNDRYAQRVLNELAVGFVDRDNKFVKEFQSTFNSAFWELYLHAVFTYLGLSIDYSYKIPDFNISNGNITVNVEAVTTSHPQNGTPEYDRTEALNKVFFGTKSDKDLEEMYEDIISIATERISNSVTQKSKKYMESYSKLEHVKNNPFVLAVGSFEQPLFYYQGIGAINRLLYGLKKAKYVDDEPHLEYTDHVLKRSSGADIPVGIFNNDAYKHISAIIFNPIASFGKIRALQSRKISGIFFETYRYNHYGHSGALELVPHRKYRESLIDGTSIFLNPHASNPLPKDFFNHRDFAIYIDENRAAIKHGFLFRRIVYNKSKIPQY